VGVFKLFLASRLRIEIFMNNKGKVVAEHMDEKWLWDLALLCDISHHLNKKLQGQRNSKFHSRINDVH
jgi:hypothetical protein